MPDRAVIIFDLPLPDDQEKLAEIITGCRRIFEDLPELSVHAAIRDKADKVLAALADDEGPGWDACHGNETKGGE